MANQRGNWTQPAARLYPHQWLWDSVFIAIGLAHYNVNRAAEELVSLERGQWSNGMVPHIIFSRSTTYWLSHFVKIPLPSGIATSGFTQPPLIAVGAAAVSKQLTGRRRTDFIRQMLPWLIRYHEWIYRERTVDESSLAVIIHPWESGMDNTPEYMRILNRHWPKEGDLALRKDIGYTASDQRPTDREAIHMLAQAKLAKECDFDGARLMRTSPFIVKDICFNSVLVAANAALVDLAQQVKFKLPRELTTRMSRTRESLATLWDNDTNFFYSYDVKNKRLLTGTATVAGFLPLFADAARRQQAKQLVQQLRDPTRFGSKFPAPSVARSYKHFSTTRYWTGPTWINMNWLICKGLEHYGFTREVEQIKTASLELVAGDGFREYYSPLTGYGLGAQSFSWTAALVIDWLHTQTPHRNA